MHIISKEKDYYDSIARQYEDSRVQYVRKPKEYESEGRNAKPIQDYPFTDMRPRLSVEYPYGSRKRYDTTNVMRHYISVLFCGKIYRGIRLTPQSKVCWDIDSLQAEILAVAERGKHIPRHKEYYTAMLDAVHNHSRANGIFNKTKTTIADWLLLNGSAYHCQYAVDQKIPIILVDYISSTYFCGVSKIVENPSNLHSVDFARAVPPWEAYQELSMYIGGVLGADAVPMVEINDNDMRLAKGFTSCSFKSCHRDQNRYRTSF